MSPLRLSIASLLLLLAASCKEAANAGPASSADGASEVISACVGLCAQLGKVCPAAAESCPKTCPALTSAQRECMSAADGCAAVSACSADHPKAPSGSTAAKPAPSASAQAASAASAPAKPAARAQPADCGLVCKRMKAACPMTAVGCSMSCKLISQAERDCLAEARNCDEVDACNEDPRPPQSPPPGASVSSRQVDVDSTQVGGGCPRPLRSSMSSGFSCDDAGECQQYCCACNPSGWPRFAASACIDGECAGEEDACSAALERSSHCR